MSKQSKSLFQSEEAKKLWDMSDDAVLEVIALGDLYPHLYMPPEVARIKVEVLCLQIFKDKDRAKALEWINANVQNMD